MGCSDKKHVEISTDKQSPKKQNIKQPDSAIIKPINPIKPSPQDAKQEIKSVMMCVEIYRFLVHYMIHMRGLKFGMWTTLSYDSYVLTCPQQNPLKKTANSRSNFGDVRPPVHPSSDPSCCHDPSINSLAEQRTKSRSKKIRVDMIVLQNTN